MMDEKNSRRIKWNTNISIISSALISNWEIYKHVCERKKFDSHSFNSIILRINTKYYAVKVLKNILQPNTRAHRPYATICQRSVSWRVKVWSDRLVTNSATYLESLAATGHGSEDIVTVHGTEDQARTIPRLGTETTTYRLPAAALQTTHAHGWQKLRATFDLHLEQKHQRTGRAIFLHHYTACCG